MKRVAVIALVVALVASAASVLAAERWIIAEWEDTAAAVLETLDAADEPSEGPGAQKVQNVSSTMRDTIAEQTAAMHDNLPSQMWGRVFPSLFLYSALVLLAGCGWLCWWQKRVTER